MQYTFKPEVRHAKAVGTGLRISTKTAAKLCRVVRGKKLSVALRLLEGLSTETRDLDGKHHTKTAGELLSIIQSCQKNAKSLGLDDGALFVHASAHRGPTTHRRRRKSGFGSRMKMTHLEVMLLERGNAPAGAKKEGIKKDDAKPKPKKAEAKK